MENIYKVVIKQAEEGADVGMRQRVSSREDLLCVLSVSGDSEEAASQTAATLKLQSDKRRFTGERERERRLARPCTLLCVCVHQC